MIGRSSLRWLERASMATGIATAVVFCCMTLPAIVARVQTIPSVPSKDGDVIPAAALGSAYLKGAGSIAEGTRTGTITVPQLHLSAPVIEGVGDSDLRRGVGHVPGSASSGGLGNMVLAAHRDTVFRSLRGIQKGMDIQVSGAEGTFHYQVDSLQVVAPDRLDVLDISDRPQVTLITCYPFNFIGSAPMRFIVKAHLRSAIPDV